MSRGLLTLGETMATVVLGAPGGVQVVAAGGEANVAATAAQLGMAATWVSRLGDDAAGDLVEDSIQACGVSTLVDRDTDRQTGLAVRELSGGRARMRYYRAGSAASRLDLLPSGTLALLAGSDQLLHVTGVTPALSDHNAALVAELAARPAGLAFDFNYRPALWESPDQAREVLLPLARSSRVVLIGDDEAEVLLGTSEAEELDGLLRTASEQLVVLKRGPGPATCVGPEGAITEHAAAVDVVDVVGAGDAFAGGFLWGVAHGLPVSGSLRLGHRMAARVLRVVGDLQPHIDEGERHALLAEAAATASEGTGSA